MASRTHPEHHEDMENSSKKLLDFIERLPDDKLAGLPLSADTNYIVYAIC